MSPVSGGEPPHPMAAFGPTDDPGVGNRPSRGTSVLGRSGHPAATTALRAGARLVQARWRGLCVALSPGHLHLARKAATRGHFYCRWMRIPRIPPVIRRSQYRRPGAAQPQSHDHHDRDLALSHQPEQSRGSHCCCNPARERQVRAQGSPVWRAPPPLTERPPGKLPC